MKKQATSVGNSVNEVYLKCMFTPIYQNNGVDFLQSANLVTNRHQLPLCSLCRECNSLSVSCIGWAIKTESFFESLQLVYMMTQKDNPYITPFSIISGARYFLEFCHI